MWLGAKSPRNSGIPSLYWLTVWLNLLYCPSTYPTDSRVPHWGRRVGLLLWRTRNSLASWFCSFPSLLWDSFRLFAFLWYLGRLFSQKDRSCVYHLPWWPLRTREVLFGQKLNFLRLEPDALGLFIGHDVPISTLMNLGYDAEFWWSTRMIR